MKRINKKVFSDPVTILKAIAPNVRKLLDEGFDTLFVNYILFKATGEYLKNSMSLNEFKEIVKEFFRKGV